MAKQEIDIGVEGNDGTGDAIREAFRKVNENFDEVYAVFGLGGQISFTNLNDTPNSTIGEEGKILAVKQDGTGIDFYQLVSDAGNADPNDVTNTVAFTYDGNKLKLRVINTNISTDPKPEIPNPLNLGAAAAYSESTHVKVLIDSDRQELIDNWNTVHDDEPTIDIDNMILSQGLADRKYLPREKPGMGDRIKDEPTDATGYTLTIQDFIEDGSGRVQINNHLLTEAATGSAFIYNSTITDASNLVSDTTYYIRREDANYITLHPTKNDALNNTNKILPTFGVGVQTLTDAAYDEDLEGFWLDDVALPRKSIVRRQGDTMTGKLTLSDHPYPYNGAGIVNDENDLQAATKYYVDANLNTLSANIYVSEGGTDDHTNTPAGREGRSENYAFRSIYAAVQKAERIQLASKVELGPYVQTLTYTESGVTYDTTVVNRTDSGFTTSGDSLTVINTIEANLRTIIDDTITAVGTQFPDFIYDEKICRRDLELILNSIKLDIAASDSSVKQNKLSIIAGLRYFANPSGEIAIDNNGQYTQTSYAITYAKTELLSDIVAAGVPASNVWYDAVSDLFDDVLTTINQANDDPVERESSKYYKVYLDSGANNFIDQAGDPQAGTPNVDIFPGKVIRGKRSGAIGTIQDYVRGYDNGGVDYDTLEIQLLEPTEFLTDEEVEYGAFVKKKQISIRVESGVYEEQLPIKIPENISLKGDEFRRVLVRPAHGPSLSKWANTWFYRDTEVDGLTVTTGGTDEWIDDLTNERRGYFGYHYLDDPASPLDISDFGKNNKGNYLEAADLIRFNKTFLVEETIAWINVQVAGGIAPFDVSFTYDQAKCRRDTGFIVDGIVKDLQLGGRSYTAENQKAYYSGSVAGQEDETEAAILNLKGIITNILTNDSDAGYTPSTGNTESQVFNTNYTAETGSSAQALELVDLVAYAFDADYNPAKNNNEMDMFLMGDNTIMRNITAQRHGGFMMVLDPEGAIRTRSPYAQTCSSFSRSLNKKGFHGGMYIDGYTYNMPMTITSRNDFFSVNVEADIGSGLDIRKPELPCSFFEFGRRYQVDAITNYTTGVSETDGVTTVRKATLILNETSHDGIGFDDDIDSAAGPVDIILQGAGNKSMLANDYTQINDLGYGVIATNNALSELVSVFTYYAHTGYYANNGAQIRSLGGNNSYGDFGMVAEGADPDEVATLVDLEQDLTMPVKMFVADQKLEMPGTGLGLARDDVIQQINDDTGNTAQGTITMAYEEDGNTIVWIKRFVDSATLYDYTFNDQDPVTDPSSTLIGIPVEVTTLATKGSKDQAFAFFFDCTVYPMNGAQLEIHHDDSDLTFQPYEVVSVQETDFEIPTAYRSTDVFSTNTDINYKVFRANFTSGTGDAATENTGLQFNIDHKTNAVLTAQQNLLLNGVTSEVLTRPSTALIFDEQEVYTYRTLAFENTIVGSIQVTGAQARVTTDDNFDYVDLTVRNDFSDHAIASYSLVGGTTLGSTPGDVHIAVNKLGADDATRLNSTDIDMIFAWDGRVHIVTQYQDVTDAVDGTGTEFGIITINNKYSIVDATPGTGIRTRVDNAQGNNTTLQAGLQEDETGNVTINISTCRATGHDFLDIGTGGYNTTNYPDRVFGAPIKKAVTDGEALDAEGQAAKAQVQERSRGRCFFASTDQDGFFRVGRFFTVDQGTGRITFNAALVLTNIDGIGFKRGTRVNEFSTDDTFTNASADTVPVETAIEGYINRRLGFDRNGNLLTTAEIIPQDTGGVMALSGITTMRADMRMGGNKIVNLADPTNGTDAANKNYVDSQVARYDTLEELEDTAISGNLATGDFLVYNGSDWEDATAVGDVVFTHTANTMTAAISAGVIVNADVKSDAAIAQSKLAMQAATTRANAAGITQADLGLASFDSANFTATNGWINITAASITNAQLAGSIANSKLANDGITFSDGTTSTEVTLGNTLTINGTTNEIDVSYSAGTYTFSLPAKIAADVDGDIYNGTDLILDVSTGELTGNADSADTVKTISTATNANFFMTFVDSNNATATAETVYTDAGVRYNPSTNKFDVTGEMECNSADVNGNINTTGNILPDSGTPTNQNIGSSTNRWGTVYGTTFNGVATEALYADLAENYLGDAAYEPGTVLVFGGEAEVTTTDTKGDRRVAGVVTTNPAHLMNSALEGDNVVGIALQGRVPINVLGRVQKGDMLVTAAKAGYAIVNNEPGVGTVIGKAVGVKDDDGYGTVEVVVGRV